MSQRVYANGRSIIHRSSQTLNIVFPDVCKTPTPGGPVPIPYPNVGQSADTSAGPATVTVDGSMPMVRQAVYPQTTGGDSSILRLPSAESEP